MKNPVVMKHSVNATLVHIETLVRTELRSHLPIHIGMNGPIITGRGGPTRGRGPTHGLFLKAVLRHKGIGNDGNQIKCKHWRIRHLPLLGTFHGARLLRLW